MKILLNYGPRCQRAVHLLFACTAVAFILLTHTLLLPSSVNWTMQSGLPVESSSPQTCVQPRLRLWHPDIRRLYPTRPAPLRCSLAEPNWAYTSNGSFFISSGAAARHGAITCRATEIRRTVGDFTVSWNDSSMAIKSGDTLMFDVFDVDCRASDGATWSLVLSGVAPSAAVRQRSAKRLPSTALGLDVLILGFDSVSRLTWMRYLPRSYAYFKDVLGGVVLEGYNIVGDGTTPNLQPLLTGRREWELPEARRGFKGARAVDDHPWIWKDFRALGYATQWGEDAPNLGTFTMRFLGFREQPVDYYLRTFYLALGIDDESRRKSYPFCHGSVPRYANMLNWMRDFVEVYEDQRKFSFVFHNEYSHENTNELQLADDDLLEFLRYLHDRGHLDRAVLMLMSDHGARFREMRRLEQGKQEERNPFFGVRLPPRFARAYPNAARNLATNAARLTTPFDVHATLRDIVDFESNPIANDKLTFSSVSASSEAVETRGLLSRLLRKEGSQGTEANRRVTDRKDRKRMPRGISLFAEIPKSRSCAEADIEPHWCACLSWKRVSFADPVVIKAAQKVVDVINLATETERVFCAPLVLSKITKAVRYLANDQLLRFFKTDDFDKRAIDMSDNTTRAEELLQVTLETSPGGALYEATVRHSLGKDDPLTSEPLEKSTEDPSTTESTAGWSVDRNTTESTPGWSVDRNTTESTPGWSVDRYTTGSSEKMSASFSTQLLDQGIRGNSSAAEKPGQKMIVNSTTARPGQGERRDNSTENPRQGLTYSLFADGSRQRIRKGRASQAQGTAEGHFAVELGAVSRINRYGEQPRCVAGRLPHLRAYCYCRV